MRFDNYLKNGLGITFVDLDETLFNTFAKVKVWKDGKIVRKLTNAEYNKYNLKPGESFDVSDFRSAQLFYDTSIPISNMIRKISIIAYHAERKGSRVIILTARGDLDNKELFLKKFRDEGFPIDKVYVERVGNTGGSAGIPAMKKAVVMKYLKTGYYRRARLFDDFLATCKRFLQLQDEMPEVHFEAFHVQEDGSVRRVK